MVQIEGGGDSRLIIEDLKYVLIPEEGYKIAEASSHVSMYLIRTI